jgi:DNA replication and repair protein RecF
VIIKSLSVFGLRNLEPQTIHFKDSLNLLLGDNGQGKTSILEAIFLLSHAKSFRTPTLKNILRNDYSDKIGSSKAVIETELGELTLEVKISGSKRELLLNDKRVSGADNFIGNLKTVLFTPDDLEIVKGAPQIRRQFLDRTLVMIDKNYTKVLLEYSKISKMRNSLLHSERFNEADLFVDNLIFLNLEISKKRAFLIENIKDYVNQAYLQISNKEDENLSLEYKSNFSKDLFINNLERDRINKRTSIGIHKDDIKIKFTSSTAEGSSRELSSQGQARTIALSFKLGAFRMIEKVIGEKPVLLFDDFEGELDESRSKAFYQVLKNTGAQVFLSTTHKRGEILEELSIREIRNGFAT